MILVSCRRVHLVFVDALYSYAVGVYATIVVRRPYVTDALWPNGARSGL